MKKITLAVLLGWSILTFANKKNPNSVIDPTKPLKKATAFSGVVNDDCANAIAITSFPFTYFQADGTEAANDGFSTTCLGPMNDGLWFTVEGNGNSLFIKATPESANYNLELGVYNGTCDDRQCIGNSDNGLGGIPEIYVIAASEIGTTYYINVGSHHAAIDQPEGNFTLEVLNLTLPANDNCSGATHIPSFPYQYHQTDGEGASMDGFVMACVDWEINDGLWYSFTGDGHDIEITVTTAEEHDVAVGVYTGSCDALECVAVVDNTDLGDEIITVSETILGTIYYINVGHYDSMDDLPEGNFSIQVSSSAPLKIEDKNLQKITVSPNPVKDALNLSNLSGATNIKIFNMLGQRIATKETTATQTQLNLASLASGTYIVRINTNETLQTIKIIKQ